MLPCKPQTSDSERIALGTAQLGMEYGVANRTGRPSEPDACALVQAALAQGLDWFDTAAAYGESEVVLGRVFAALGVQDKVNVVSKGSGLATDGQTLTTRVAASLSRLKVARLSAWLLHDESQLSSWDARARREADELRIENLVGSFGVSTYHPEMALRAIEECGLTSAQFPANPMDRRFLRGDVFSRLAKPGVQLFVRSVYLQGLCLMDATHVPGDIFRGREAVQVLTDFCGRHDLERDHFCLQYVLQRTASAGAWLVIGVERRQQLDRNLKLLSAPPIDSAYLDEWDALWPDDHDDLVLPFRWKAGR